MPERLFRIGFGIILGVIGRNGLMPTLLFLTEIVSFSIIF